MLYKNHYDYLMDSGLYEVLTKKKLLISHTECENMVASISGDAYKIVSPNVVPFISYPYEWSFSQLKDAALATLEIQKLAMEFGMTLKDASAYNIQFMEGMPVFIDTLSFEIYQEGETWKAYRQFCQHFLAPLALMSYTDIRLNQLLKIYVDGIPLDMTCKLLPMKTYMKPGLLSHLHLHALSQKTYEQRVSKSNKKISRTGFNAIIDSLESVIRKLTWKPSGTEWGDYYSNTNYSDKSLSIKKSIIENWVNDINPKTAWDIGANTGFFSRAVSDKNIFTVSFDIDPAAVEKNYLVCKEKKEKNILPLIVDLTNPTPGVGWENLERASFIERGKSDVILALALIHHLAISNNVPLQKIALFFSKLCNNLIIEFVPKNDSQVKRLLSTREDIFPEYNQSNFEEVFKTYFDIGQSSPIEGSERILYLMKVKNAN